MRNFVIAMACGLFAFIASAHAQTFPTRVSTMRTFERLSRYVISFVRRADRDQTGCHRRDSLTTIRSGDVLADGVGMTRAQTASRERVIVFTSP